MSFSASYLASQTLGQASKLNLSDTSSGTDGAINHRRVYLTRVDSSTLVPVGTITAYVLWSGFPSTSTIVIDALDKDYALSLKVDWCNSAGTVLYTSTTLVMLSLYSEAFYYSLTQMQAVTPGLFNDINYYENKMKLRVEVDSAAQAVSFGGDQYSAQSALDRATFLRLNPTLFF